MKIKIVNMKRFITSILLILGLFIGLSFIINNHTLSHGETKYKTVYITSGDTLWNIAKEEQDNNEYYQGKDIRDIIINMKKLNHLENSDLIIGQKLQVPIL